MTDSATAGSVAAVEQPAGTPAQPPAAPANGSTGAVETPFSGLSEGTRKWVETKGYKSHEDVATAAMNSESKIGSMFSLPAADAPEAEWQEKVFSRLPEAMRPVASPDKIEFKRPEGLPENLPYDDALANTSKTWMAEAGLNARQAQAMHDKFAGHMASQAQARLEAVAKSVEATHDDLVKDWGPVDSDSYKQKLELSSRAMKKLGLVDAYKAKGILLEDGALTDPQIARAFLAVGEAMFKEDTLEGERATTGANPFKRDAKGERSVTAISELVKSDPERARRLAREAGEDPAVWMPNNPY